MNKKISLNHPSSIFNRTFHRKMPVIIILSAFLFLNISYGQINQSWKYVHPKPQGNDLHWIKALDASNWVAAGNGGTFLKTTDSGTTWTCITNAGGTLPGYGHGKDILSGWFFNMNTGFICGTDGWIAKTTNGGINWDSVPSGTTNDLYSVQFLNANTGFMAGGTRNASGTNGVVIKTTNGGTSWDTLNYDNAHNNTGGIFALDANHLYVALAHVIYNGGVFYGLRMSTDGGTIWTSAPTGPDQLFDVFFVNADTGFVCGLGGVVKRTTNRGSNWISYNPAGSGLNYYKFIFSAPNTIYVSGDGLCYNTTNYGGTWTEFNPTDPALLYSPSWYRMDVVSGTMMVCGTGGLMSKSTNSGSNWSQVSSVSAYDLFCDVWCETGTGKVWAVGVPATFPMYQVIYSSNGGTTWNPQEVNGSFQAYLGISMINGSTGYISASGGEIAKTTNGGTNWNVLTTAIPTDQNLGTIDFIDVSTGWVFSNSTNAGGNIWKTTNGGTNWAVQNSGLSGNEQIIYSADMVDANTGWFVNEAPGKPYKTTNGGVNWTQQLIQGSFTGKLYDVKMLNTSTGYVCGGDNFAAAPNVLLKTTNGGSTAWEVVATPFSNMSLTSTDWADANHGVIATRTGLTARTTNAGQSWTVNNTSMQEVFRIQMRSFDTMYAVTGLLGAPGTPFAIMKFQDGFVNVTSWENAVPKEYFLSQNYPNPFNPNTIIKFGLPKAGLVSLKVYDITGKLVKDILSNVSLNAGTVTQQFDGAGLSSGIYFYTLTIDNSSIDTKKMVLVK